MKSWQVTAVASSVMYLLSLLHSMQWQDDGCLGKTISMLATVWVLSRDHEDALLLHMDDVKPN